MRETLIEDAVEVGAPAAAVWAAINDPAVHAGWHPFLTEIKGEHGAGAERVCTVNLGGKVSHTRERCIAYEAERRIIWRIDEDSSGFSRMVNEWTAGFSLEPRRGGTFVTAQSAFRPRNLFVRLAMPMVRRKFHQTQKAILSGLKQHVEAAAASPTQRIG